MAYVPEYEPRKPRQSCLSQVMFVIITALMLMLVLFIGLRMLGW